jgi:hypothetical protein
MAGDRGQKEFNSGTVTGILVFIVALVSAGVPDLATDDPTTAQHSPHYPDLSPLRQDQLLRAVGFL